MKTKSYLTSLWKVSHIFWEPWFFHVVLIQVIGILGEVDSPELLETPDVMEMTENFAKVIKYLAKLRETLMSFAWEKSHVKKQ